MNLLVSSMKKKMIIYMSKLSVGGMEKALLNLVKYSNITNNYDVTIYALYSLEEKYLNELLEKVNVKLLWKRKWNIIGKMICSIKICFTILKLLICKNNYDVAICYPYQHPILSKLTRLTCKNNIIFIHSNLEMKYGNRALQHVKKMKLSKFKKVVCVSNNAKESFMKLCPNYQGKCIVINNYINGDEIINKSSEKVSDNYKDDNPLFISIARHVEETKKISRIINASKKLVMDGYKFKVMLVGDGIDHNYYKEMIDNYKLNNIVYLLGKKINPYPYLKMADCLVFSSLFEGYGIVLDEARILGKPVITTDVADAKMITDDGYGILCKNSDDGIYNGMKEYLDNGYKLKNKFDYITFNKKITKEIDELVE